jgi:hypothetical protein
MIIAGESRMTWLQFISSVVSSVAWPLAVVFALLLVRKQLISILERMLELHLPGGTKIILRDVLAKNDQIIKQIELPKDEAPKVAPPQPEVIDPLARVINAWAQVEEMLRVAGEQLGFQGVQAQRVMNVLRNKKLIAPGTFDLFENLRAIRNSVAHARLVPTDNEADHYVAQAEVLKEALMVAGNNTP